MSSYTRLFLFHQDPRPSPLLFHRLNISHLVLPDSLRLLVLMTRFTSRPTDADNRCQQCAGKGKRITRLCPRCKGNKVLDTQHTLAVHIPAGAPEGFEEVFSGEADESTEWEAGDVVVRVRSQKKDGEGGWGRKENGIVGRVVLSVAEVSLLYFLMQSRGENGDCE